MKTIKKTILGLAAVALLMFSSCNKEEVFQNCNCGIVMSDRVSDYSVVIRNNCTRNDKRWILQPGDWINAYVGSNYCITNATKW